ncbi:MAG: nucleotidyl transferase AbiEii/AbiGii toxin family protein [Spirochaetales bacterium]|nr:nucleotidyl transferase AbiEii/AbiGii toxin family protein [Spirochaetales bacterium]
MADNRFESMIEGLFRANPEISYQRTAVEKELFHQDILRILRQSGILDSLVFMGGTCLRLCYGSNRLSEDLDFSTEKVFSAEEMDYLSESVSKGLNDKYSLAVMVRKPEKDTDTDTWIVRIITHPQRPDIPSQQIHLDICHYKSYRTELRRVNNYYPIDFGSGQLFIRAESLEEILADKLLAFASRNRIKNRDLWDIEMLNERRVSFNPDLMRKKINDHRIAFDDFMDSAEKRVNSLLKDGMPSDFKAEMMRFVPAGDYEKSILSTYEAGRAIATIIRDYVRLLS